jgi:hypothetical protein
MSFRSALYDGICKLKLVQINRLTGARGTCRRCRRGGPRLAVAGRGYLFTAERLNSPWKYRPAETDGRRNVAAE